VCPLVPDVVVMDADPFRTKAIPVSGADCGWHDNNTSIPAVFSPASAQRRAW
jgi:hypothetical protein